MPLKSLVPSVRRRLTPVRRLARRDRQTDRHLDTHTHTHTHTQDKYYNPRSTCMPRPVLRCQVQKNVEMGLFVQCLYALSLVSVVFGTAIPTSLYIFGKCLYRAWHAARPGPALTCSKLCHVTEEVGHDISLHNNHMTMCIPAL